MNFLSKLKNREWQVTIIANVFSILVLLGVVTPDLGEELQAQVNQAALHLMGITNAGFAISRGIAKRNGNGG